MNATEFFHYFLQETSRIRLAKHCPGLNPTLADFDGQLREDGSYKDFICSVMLWGGSGRITLRAHFDLETATAWTLKSLGTTNNEIPTTVAIDFLREYCNLYFGYLRGFLESAGMLLGISLPFIMSGDSEAIFIEMKGSNRAKTETANWQLTDGTHSIFCTAEFEMHDRKALDAVRPELEKELENEVEKQASGDGGGDVEFLF